MPADPISPIAPARVRAVFLPVGRIKKSKFESFVDRLRPEYMVRLGDISQDVRPNTATFSPLAFPNGRILYDFATSNPPISQDALSSFETFREPLLVIGIVDGSEYILCNANDVVKETPTLRMSTDDTGNLQESIDQLRNQYPMALVFQLLAFDLKYSDEVAQLPKEATRVPTPAQSRTTTIKTIMCDISAKLLAEMALFARAIPDLQSVEARGTSAPSRPGSAPLSSGPSVDLMRSSSFRDQYSRTNSSVTNDNAGTEVFAEAAGRESLPASGAITQENSRPSSPADGPRTPPAITGTNDSGLKESPGDHVRNGIRSASIAAYARDPSLDRLTTGTVTSTSVSVTERAKHNLKARQAILLGSLHLQAGRWPDALRELVDGTTRARAFSDYLGHAKGLENILVALLMLAWVNADFQIPQICYPIGGKLPSGKWTSSGNAIGMSDPSRRTDTSETRVVNELSSILPNLIHMILSIHDRAANSRGEVLPQFSYSQCVIRLSNLLSVLLHSNGQLNRDALQCLVRGRPLLCSTSLVTRSNTVAPSRQDIATILFRSFPGKPATSHLSLLETVIIFSGIATVLSLLNLQRKRAMVVKEMLSSLIPGLIQARKIGAAEVGIHPAAGLSALYESNTYTSGRSTDAETNENDFERLLSWLCEIYGAHNGIPAQPEMIGPGPTHSIAIYDEYPSHKAVLDRIMKESELRYFGGFNLKTDILRLCCNVSEALPDFSCTMRFTAALLKVAGPGSILVPDFVDSPVALTREDQIRLATKMHQILRVMPGARPSKIEMAYWDDFLVRDISLSAVLDTHKLTRHSQSELRGIARFAVGSQIEVRDPFIHNHHLKADTDAPAENVLVAGERTDFVVSLQNLYDFEVVLDNIVLITEGIAFASQPLSIVLRPYRTQQVVLSGTPMMEGDLCITGCRVKIEGCHQQDFLVFRTAWKPAGELKIKRSGLASAPRTYRRSNKISLEPHLITYNSVPQPITLSFKVCTVQPLAIIASNTLSQSTMTVLVGETKSFSVLLRNTSISVPIDFVHLSFEDSISSSVPGTTTACLGPSELHELEHQNAYQRPFRWRQTHGLEPLLIQPGASACFKVDVLGKPGLTSGLVHIAYANLGILASTLEEKFFTRQVSLPLAIMANPSIQLQCFDVLQLGATARSIGAWHAVKTSNQDEPEKSQADLHPSRPVTDSLAIRSGHENQDSFRKNSFILLLDLRNVYLRPLAISIGVRNNLASEANMEVRDSVYSTNKIIQPGHVARVVLSVPKLSVENPYQSIPLMNPANKRQFIVGGDHRSSGEEKETRAAFWFRQELLKHIDGRWEEFGLGRKGMIDLRGLKLSPSMIEVIRRDDVEINMDVLSGEIDTVVIKTGPAVFEAKTNEMLILQARLRNRTQLQIRPFLRFQPRLSTKHLCSVVELTRRMAWTGLLKRPGPILDPGQICEITLGLSILSAGHYEIGAPVDAIQSSPILDANKDPRSGIPGGWRGDKSSSTTPEAGRSANVGNSLCTLIVRE